MNCPVHGYYSGSLCPSCNTSPAFYPSSLPPSQPFQCVHCGEAGAHFGKRCPMKESEHNARLTYMALEHGERMKAIRETKDTDE